MAAGDALHVSGGTTDAREARVAQGGLLAAQGPTAMDVRTGVLVGPGSTALVTGTADTAPMTVAIAPHVAVTARSTANGPMLGPTLDVATTVPITAAPASGTRTDVVYVKQRDADPNVLTPDTTTAPIYGVVQGTVGGGKPSLATAVGPGAEELATVQVSAGATATTGAGVVITNTARQTSPRGTPIHVRSQAERDALATYENLRVWRLDTRRLEVFSNGAWQYAGGAPPPIAVADPGSGWAVVANQAPGVFKDSSGLVQVVGAVQPASAYNPQDNTPHTACQLPAGFRPGVTTYFGIPLGNSFVTAAVATSGLISIVGGTTTSVAATSLHPLSGIRFHPGYSGSMPYN